MVGVRGSRYFFYGTLLDAEVRALVLGRARPALTPARLDGYRRVCVRGRPYPIVIPDPGGSVAGLLAWPVDRRGAARLDRFEGGEYLKVERPVALAAGRRVTALVYVARSPAVASARPWSLEAWRRTGKRGLIRRHRR